MQVAKLHGLGNDYVYVNGFEYDIQRYDLSKLAEVLSDRHFGVGGDGIILVLESSEAEFAMRIFNSDGSEAEMCGNGVRGFAKYVYERGMTDKKEFGVQTPAGIVRPSLQIHEGTVEVVRVDMGPPKLNRSDIPMQGTPEDEPVIDENLTVDGHELKMTCVSMGNPHCVIFVEETDAIPILWMGPLIEHHKLFPQRTNVEFCTVQDRGTIQMRVWERGAGMTLACGTGACATAVAAVLNDLTDRKVEVNLDGGDLFIEWADNDHVFLTGPAEEVFEATVNRAVLEEAIL